MNQRGFYNENCITFFSICIIFIVSESTFAQTASDYFFPPLTVGSQVTLSTPGGGDLGWEARTTTYSIEGIDTIAGQKYYREVGREFSIPPTVWTDIFQVFWIRKDSVGNVVIGAMSTSESTNLDSATIVGGIMYSNEFLTKGYSRTYPFGNLTGQDSVLSTTESVIVPAGTFSNCLEMSDTHFDSSGTAVFREYQYFAYGVGMVKNIRIIPNNQAHTDELLTYITT